MTCCELGITLATAGWRSPILNSPLVSKLATCADLSDPTRGPTRNIVPAGIAYKINGTHNPPKGANYHRGERNAQSSYHDKVLTIYQIVRPNRYLPTTKPCDEGANYMFYRDPPVKKSTSMLIWPLANIPITMVDWSIIQPNTPILRTWSTHVLLLATHDISVLTKLFFDYGVRN